MWWQADRALRTITLFDHRECGVHFAGEVKNFDPAKYMDFKEARRRDRFCQMGVAAARMALDQAGAGDHGRQCR